MARVLLVDDNGSVLLTLAIALRRRGHDVTTAANGTQALAQLFNHNFDVVVSDVRMPDMSGVQLASIIQKNKYATRVILTSAYSTLEAHQSVAEAFLRKPIEVMQLDELLNRQPPKTDLPLSKTRQIKRRGRRRSWFSLRERETPASKAASNNSSNNSFGGALPA